MRYLPCELHCHTVHSDGDFLPLQLQQQARAEGLSLIALTDHNTATGCAELDSAIIPFINGIEWTTYFGHMLVLGAEKFVDWRDAVPDNIDEKISQVKAANGLVGIAHPFQLGSPMCTGGRWEFKVNNWSNVDYIEIWHEAFPNNAENDNAFKMWTSMLDEGYHIAASYGRDWHRPDNSNSHCGCTYLGFDGEPCRSGALDAIRYGRTVVSTGAELSFAVLAGGKSYQLGSTIPKGEVVFDVSLDLNSRADCYGENTVLFEELRIATNGGKIVYSGGCNSQQIKLMTTEGCWYRAELWGKLNGKEKILAVTSPIYCGY